MRALFDYLGVHVRCLNALGNLEIVFRAINEATIHLEDRRQLTHCGRLPRIHRRYEKNSHHRGFEDCDCGRRMYETWNFEKTQQARGVISWRRVGMWGFRTKLGGTVDSTTPSCDAARTASNPQGDVTSPK